MLERIRSWGKSRRHSAQKEMICETVTYPLLVTQYSQLLRVTSTASHLAKLSGSFLEFRGKSEKFLYPFAVLSRVHFYNKIFSNFLISTNFNSINKIMT
jgi:hypothetical protein